MAEEYKPEFLSKGQKKFIQNHRKTIRLVTIVAVAILGFLIVWPFVYDFADMKIKEHAIHSISQNLSEDIPSDWRESQRCVERRQKMATLPPICYVDVSSSFAVNDEGDVRKIIDKLYGSMSSVSGVSFKSDSSDKRAFLDLSAGIHEVLALPSYEQSGKASGGRTFEVRWSSDEGCRVGFRLRYENDLKKDDTKLDVVVECGKITKLTYYRLTRY